MIKLQRAVEWDLTALASQAMGGDTEWCDNLTKEEKKSLEKLEEDDTIVIRNSDKGGLIVVMDTDTYIGEATRQLSDTCTYVHLWGDPTKQYISVLARIVKRGTRVGIFNQKRSQQNNTREPSSPHILPPT